MSNDVRTLLLRLEGKAQQIKDLQTEHVPDWITEPSDFRIGAATAVGDAMLRDLAELRRLLGVPAPRAPGEG